MNRPRPSRRGHHALGAVLLLTGVAALLAGCSSGSQSAMGGGSRHSPGVSALPTSTTMTASTTTTV